MLFHSRTLLIICALGVPAADFGQSTRPDPNRVLELAIKRLKDADSVKTRFTRFNLEHNVVFDGTGKMVADTHKLFEDTWINDLPYSRLVEGEGKPLEGKALADEQARFDKAVAERKALTSGERAKLTGGHHFSTTIAPEAVLTPAYKLTALSDISCAAQPCHTYQAERLLNTFDGKPVLPYTYRFWVTDSSPLIARIEYDVTADLNDLQKGSAGILEFQTFDGVPVLQHSRFIGFVTVRGNHIHIDTDNTYTRYRQFSTTVTVQPAADDSRIPATPRP